MNAYQRKCKRRLESYLRSQFVPLHKVTEGTLNGVNSYCFILEPESSRMNLSEISSNAQKQFKKAAVKLGKGSHPIYAPEMYFPTIFLSFRSEQHV